VVEGMQLCVGSCQGIIIIIIIIIILGMVHNRYDLKEPQASFFHPTQNIEN